MNEHSFDEKRIAEGYAKDRPYLHGRVMDAIKETLKITKPFQNGLDVGCGAGLSAKALKTISEKVVGADISAEMVAAAKALYSEPEYRFLQSSAETISLEENAEKFDIVTAAGVINWVDEKLFLENLGNIMEENGVLLIYDFWISDRMEKVPAYTEWWHDHYLKHYPKPSRKENVWKQQDIEPYGFLMEKQENFAINHRFSLDSFVRFMMVQSNVNEQITTGKKTAEQIRGDLTESLRPIFSEEERTLCFDGYYWAIRYEGNAGGVQARLSDGKMPQAQTELPNDAFVSIKQYIPDIVVELKYATEDNFTHHRVYDFDEVYARWGTVKKLQKVQEILKNHGMKLKVWDAFRPVAAQFKFWEIMPDDRFIADPNRGFSCHSRGSAVDVTLVYADGRDAEMPSEFDDFSDASNRDYSKCSLQTAKNAELLENIMRENGFDPYFDEWWHFYDLDQYPVEKEFAPPRSE